MKFSTKLLNPNNSEDIDLAAKLLREGGCVAFPTETVYGLGADATNSTAIEKAFVAKGRPLDNPLIVHLHSPIQLNDYCHSIPAIAYLLMDAFCPGPLTLVLPRKQIVAPNVTAGLDTVAIRFPNHSTARKLLEQCGLPLAAPSANLSGRPSATTWQSVLEDLGGRIDAIICDDPSQIGIESTVIDVTVDPVVILRCGSITLEAVQKILPSIVLNSSLGTSTNNSPGLRHKHYQPTAKVLLITSASDGTVDLHHDDLPASIVQWAYIGISKLPSRTENVFAEVAYCKDATEYASKLFSYFRHCDSQGFERIYCESVPEEGLGRALMDRLRRASQEVV